MSKQIGSHSGNTDQRQRLERLRWRSRRGLLELELLLGPFVDQRLAELSPELLDLYERLLEHEDVDVHEWLLGRRPEPETLRAIVTEIRTQQSLLDG